MTKPIDERLVVEKVLPVDPGGGSAAPSTDPRSVGSLVMAALLAGLASSGFGRLYEGGIAGLHAVLTAATIAALALLGRRSVGIGAVAVVLLHLSGLVWGGARLYENLPLQIGATATEFLLVAFAAALEAQRRAQQPPPPAIGDDLCAIPRKDYGKARSITIHADG